MGCFFACFGSSKDRRRKEQSIRRAQPRVQRCPSFKPVHVQLPVDPFPESQCKVEQVSAETAIGPFPEPHCKNELVEQLSLSSRKKVTFDSNIKTYEAVDTKNVFNEGNSEKSTQSQSSSQDSSVTSVESFPPSHRYQNCRESDEEDEEEEYYSDSEHGLSDNDDHDEEMLRFGTKSCADQVISKVSDSPRDSGSPRISTMMSRGLSEHNAGVRDRSVYVDNVLNPVENLSQWKAVKSLGKPSATNPRKENMQNNVASVSPTAVAVAVDASLSNWLGSSSGTRYEDRQILGGLSEFSGLSSPSSCRSPKGVPIIGSVGSYWSDSGSGRSVSSFKGIPNTTSKYREDRKVSWHSTPFETRLERALQRGAAAKAL